MQFKILDKGIQFQAINQGLNSSRTDIISLLFNLILVKV